MIEFAVDALAQGLVGDQLGERALLDVEALGGGVEDAPLVMELLQEAEEDFATCWGLAPFVHPALLDQLDVLALFHMAGQSLFVGA